MPWQLKAASLTGSPVGVSMQNGTGTSGILCGIDNGQLLLREYLYHTQFALKHYPVYTIADVNPYPACPPARFEYSYSEGI